MIGVQDLILPKRKIAVPLPPSYIKFDGAFGLGTGIKLGDKSRYRSHGTIHGADWATGAHGKCLDFDASAKDYVEIPASYTQLDFTTQDFSIILRFKQDTIGAYKYLLSRGKSNTDGWAVYILTGNRVYLRTNQSGTGQTTSSEPILTSISAWYTVGFSRSGSSVKAYVDGVDKTEIAGTHIDPVTCSRSTKISIYDDKASAALDGKMEFLRIFGGIALPASTHLAYHNALK